jgi:hypothetical protein
MISDWFVIIKFGWFLIFQSLNVATVVWYFCYLSAFLWKRHQRDTSRVCETVLCAKPCYGFFEIPRKKIFFYQPICMAIVFFTNVELAIDHNFWQKILTAFLFFAFHRSFSNEYCWPLWLNRLMVFQLMRWFVSPRISIFRLCRGSQNARLHRFISTLQHLFSR